jgi:thiamine biosynthesis lipoprotein
LIGGAGVATSGDYERCFVKDGVRYHHLLDATTGRPAEGLMSATVVAASAFHAGRLATAAFLLGPQEGLARLERMPGVEGCLIDTAGALAATAGMGRISNLPGSLYADYPAL